MFTIYYRSYQLDIGLRYHYDDVHCEQNRLHGLFWDGSLLPDQYIKRTLEASAYDIAVETPIHGLPLLSENLGNEILLKREDLQPVFSFKLRGAYNH